MNRRFLLLVEMDAQLYRGHLVGGRYKIIGVLGQGGMGTVYAAEDRRLPGKEWAIKEIRGHGNEASELVSEAAMLVKLSHPNLPQIVDYFASEDGHCGYLVMERIEGETLEERFERQGKAMPLHDVIRYAIQICDALTYLHGTQPSPTIHRDLKPSNLLIDGYDRIVLIDFGTARTYKAGHAQDTVQLGTLGFAAPEQLTDEQTDPRTDLYALGSILFYLLSGGHYYVSSGESRMELVAACPMALHAVIEKLLRTNKEERFASAHQVKTELEQVASRMYSNEHSTSIDVARTQMMPRKRVVVLMSLHPGAGSTMIGLALTGMLNQAAISHTYMEHPAIDPILGAWVDNSRHSCTSWIPDPAFEQVYSSSSSEWSVEVQLRLLFDQPSPIIIVDVSDRWEDPTVTELMRLADELIVVTGPRRMLLESQRYQSRITMLSELADQEKRIHMFLNGCDSLSIGPEFFNPLTAQTWSKLPFCSNLRLLEWNGRLARLHDDPGLSAWRNPIEQWLKQLLREWGFLSHARTNKGRGWFRR
jgi:serine/threonine protein kinase